MNIEGRDFLLLAALAAAATPSWGQAAGQASSGTPSVASTPDLSGAWTHPYVGFELPLSGPGPVRNSSRLRAGPQAGVGDGRQLVGDYTNPILKPQAAEIVKQHGEISVTGVTYPTPLNQCWPQPLPYVFQTPAMWMLQQPNQITIFYAPDHEVRQVRLNQPHPARVTPSWSGDSVGHYEGDELVIDTVGIKADRPFAMVDTYGTPYTEALHVVERYRLIDYEAAEEAQNRARKEHGYIPLNDSGLSVDPNYKGKGLQLQFTVEDDGVFTMPWSATVTYRRSVNDWFEYVCAENTHKYNTERDAAVPTADKPDF